MSFEFEKFTSRAEAFEASEDRPSNPSVREIFGDIVQSRYVSRRSVRRSMTAVAAITAIATPLETLVSRAAQAATRGFDFPEISHGVNETHHVAEGYAGDVLIRWEDPVLAGAPGFAPMPFGSNNPERALLCVNHEYTNEEVMFPGIGRQEKTGFSDMTAELVNIEMAAHGGSVVLIEKQTGNGPRQAIAPSIAALQPIQGCGCPARLPVMTA